MAAIGAVLWTWVIIDAQVPATHIAAIMIAETLAFTAGRPLQQWLHARKGRT